MILEIKKVVELKISVLTERIDGGDVSVCMRDASVAFFLGEWGEGNLESLSLFRF